MIAAAPWLEPAVAGLLGLLIGSFLNVLVYRLPKMMERRWAHECAELTGSAQGPAEQTFNLWTPRSACPQCAAPIAWQHNIPVASYVLLAGKCSRCHGRISPRYPAVEIASACLFSFAGQRWGISAAGAAWCTFCAALLALALIDWDTTLLPDDIVLPLLWLGLIGAQLQWTQVPLPSALWGAVGGYLFLWSVYWLFKLATGKEGMGYGDFKLLACLGAWFGWQALIPITLLSSIIGAIVGLVLKMTGGLRPGNYIPFGPFLAGAGFVCMVFGADVLQKGLSL